jgi:hypothetical protein
MRTDFGLRLPLEFREQRGRILHPVSTFMSSGPALGPSGLRLQQNTFGRKCTEGPCHSPRRNQLPPNRSGLTQPGGYPGGSRQSPLTGGPRLAVTSSHPIQYALRMRCGRLVGLRASHCAELTSSKLGRAIGILCYNAFQHRDCLFVRPEIRRESEVVPVEIVSFLAFWAGTVSMKLLLPG